MRVISWLKVTLGVIALGMSAPAADAVPITFKVTGSVSFVGADTALGGIAVGAPFTALYTFESTAADVRSNDPTVGNYRSAILEVDLSVGLHRLVYVPDRDFAKIELADFFSDSYSVDARGFDVPYGSAVAWLIGFSFRSTGIGMLDGDALPLVPIVSRDISVAPLDGDLTVSIRLSDADVLTSNMRFAIRTFTVVPEPGTVWMLGMGLSLVAGRVAARRRSADRSRSSEPCQLVVPEAQ